MERLRLSCWTSIATSSGRATIWRRTDSSRRKLPVAPRSSANIAHVWSTYESRHKEDDPQPFMRGINSIQLLYDDSRWWIVTVYWQHESPEDPIPEKYLKRLEV
jgi:hypothetical protein